jgi:putative membrane protein
MPDPPKASEETLRLHQANERTILAWIRTGIPLMAFCFAITRFGVFLRQVASLG